MPKFIQLHFLTAYPPSNPNRDDLGHPKTAIVGGATRLRISSQALKRSARLSPIMQEGLRDNLGTRTLRIGEIVAKEFEGAGLSEADKLKLIQSVMTIFGKVRTKEGEDLLNEQLAFISPQERALALDLARKAAQGEPLPEQKDLKEMILTQADGAVDIAMFGRMLAGAPEFNREAAVQVSHAFTTHSAEVEDDFFTAVDDLKQASEDVGAAYLGDAGFGSGLFYTYVCIDRDLLIENLSGDKILAQKGAALFAQAMAQSTPTGKQNSFANRVKAAFIRAEADDYQPRSLADAFFEPIPSRGNIPKQSIKALQACAQRIDHAYDCAPRYIAEMNVLKGKGNINDIIALIEQAFKDV